MTFINWMIDSLASEDIIDLYFVLSDLVEVNQTPQEVCLQASMDSLATGIVATSENKSQIPIGKLVL